jgi:DNA primase
MNDRFLEDLKNRVDIVEIIHKYAELKKSGKNFMCRSPFRNERTPSFSVSPDKQLWYDFGSAEGGDAISFLEKVENISFQEAVEMLAQTAGIEMPKSFGENKGPNKAQKQDIFTLHEKAAEFFQAELKKSKAAQKYIADRQLDPKTVADWKLGYGGDGTNDLTKHLLQSGFSEANILQSGVAFERSFGEKAMKDRFGGRVMIPICEPREGKIAAFSGRDILDRKNTGKYINSPENPVYHKSSTLFGLDRARKVISDLDQAILVEGNFDVISAHRLGFTHTVATCGTALTDDHLRILKRLTKNIYLAFDSDMAGKKATLRSVEMILKMELHPYIIEITGGKDFDDLAQANPKALKETIEKAQPALELLLERFAEKCLNKTIDGEKKFLDAFFYFLRLVNRPIEVDEFLSRVAKKLGRAKGIIEQEFQKFTRQQHDKPKFVAETKKEKFTREQSFVGFLNGFWDFFADKVNLKLLDLLTEEEPLKILEKKLKNEPLDKEEKIKLTGWELHQTNLYSEDISEDRLQTDCKNFIAQFQQEKAKQERTKAARDLQL